MGMVVAVMGASGSGKTSSLRKYKPGEIFIYEVAGKSLPFKSAGMKKYIMETHDYGKIESTMKSMSSKCKTFIIDDSQYLMAFESFDKAKQVGYEKFTTMAFNFQKLLRFVKDELPEDVIVFFLHHVSKDDDGFMHLKTLGKMLDNQLTIDGLFTIILYACKNQKHYVFETSDPDGLTTAKTPIGMFEEQYIDNDLKMVENTIRDYYDIKLTTNDEKKEEMTNEKN